MFISFFAASHLTEPSPFLPATKPNHRPNPKPPQLHGRRRALYPWARKPGLDNAFFQHVGPEGLGVGGSGHWAIFLDSELLRGSSGECATFASPCLAAGEEFEVLGVELWRV